MIIEENNVFSFTGIVETPESYVGAVALYDYFWVLKPELRLKLIKSWIKVLEKCAEEGFLEDVAPEFAEGAGLVFIDNEPLEIRNVPDNVVPFRRRKHVERIEKKKDEC